MTAEVEALLRPEAEILLIVPPFAWLDRPALGVHLLQALAREAGREVQVLYANFLFARFFDEGTHNTVAQMQYGLYLGERLFARAALGSPPLGVDGGEGMVPTIEALVEGYRRMGVQHSLSLASILALEARVTAWIDSFVPAIAKRGYTIVGATSSFEQNLSAITMLDRVKQLAPATTAILGGANCEGEMGEALCAIAPRIDHIFSGESDATFTAFLRGERRERLIVGEPCDTLDAIPAPDYTDYFTQLDAVLPHTELSRKRAVHLTYESSRGCWWGQKSHCTFCGLNGNGMRSRNKSPERVLADLREMTERHGVKRIAMTDNIMPHEYFTSFLPRLQETIPGIKLMYEEKANLKLEQVRTLVAAGVIEIQPGIEAISTGLLKLMAKGTTTAQNVNLLRYSKSSGLFVQWNLLHGFPNDDVHCYEETNELMPLMHHLQPPVSPCPVVVDRFSPYFERPADYGITDVRPFSFYRGVYGPDVPLAKLAYHFEGTYPTTEKTHPVVKQMAEEVMAWRRRFYSPSPAKLQVERRGDAHWLVDTRGVVAGPTELEIERRFAIAAIATRGTRSIPADELAWILDRKLGAIRDGKLVVFAIAEPDLFSELERAAPPRALEQLRAVS